MKDPHTQPAIYSVTTSQEAQKFVKRLDSARPTLEITIQEMAKHRDTLEGAFSEEDLFIEYADNLHHLAEKAARLSADLLTCARMLSRDSPEWLARQDEDAHEIYRDMRKIQKEIIETQCWFADSRSRLLQAWEAYEASVARTQETLNELASELVYADPQSKEPPR